MRFISRLLHKVRGLVGLWIAGFRGREQHAQGIALMEMRQPGDAATPGKCDFSDARRRDPCLFL